MKLKGQRIAPPSPVNVKFYRGKDVIELLIAPILNYDEFDKLVQPPKPPVVSKISTGSSYLDYNDARYKSKFNDYIQLKSDYILIKGLEATEGLEWDTVKLSEPDTWKNVKTDLATCFTENEIVELIQAASEANSPTEKRQKEAFDSFIATQEHLKDSLSQEVGQEDTQSGGPANVSE